MRRDDIAIVGGGPAGLEAALYARAVGRSASVYEAGAGPGASVARWRFVRLFSPWSMNTSELGLAVLRTRGLQLPDPDAYPTGAEFVELYLQPIAEALGPDFHASTRVLGIARRGLLKSENIGGRRRASTPFRLLLDEAGRESSRAAGVVVDASGVYTNPCALGDGGLPVPGERELEGRIRHHLADVEGAERASFAGRTTLVVGSGFSAATSLSQLLELRKTDPATKIIWARRESGPAPLPIFDGDPLPRRTALGVLANRVAAEPPDGVQVLSGVAVERCADGSPRIAVQFCPVDGGGTPSRVEVDEILACVGYRPDLSLTRELQADCCRATEAPTGLGTALLERAGPASAGNFLAHRDIPDEALRSSEPGLFVIGQKSYGRRGDYLVSTGRQQVRGVFRLLEDGPAVYRDSRGSRR